MHMCVESIDFISFSLSIGFLNCSDSVMVSFFLLLLTYKEEEFEGTKEVIKIRKSKKDRQHNGQIKILRCSGRVASSCSTKATLQINSKITYS